MQYAAKEGQMTENKNAKYVQALVRELAGYEARGLVANAAEVRAELERVGAAGAPPARRAAKRVVKGRESR